MSFITRVYRLLIRLGPVLAPVALLIIRLAWGWELLESGWGHLHNVAGMTARFEKWGVPFPHANVYISGTTELVGGALWMVGLGTRLISLPLLFNFCIAYLTASHDTVVQFFKQDPSNFIDDAAFPFLVASILLIAMGPGLISLDALIKHMRGSGSVSTA